VADQPCREEGDLPGKVEAADAETAIRAAIQKYDIKPEHQARLRRAES
jgi:hypothetical protein